MGIEPVHALESNANLWVATHPIHTQFLVHSRIYCMFSLPLTLSVYVAVADKQYSPGERRVRQAVRILSLRHFCAERAGPGLESQGDHIGRLALADERRRRRNLL